MEEIVATDTDGQEKQAENPAAQAAEKTPRINAAKERKNRRKAGEKAKQYTFLAFAILLSGILRAFGVHFFILPHDFAVGGVTGIATMLENSTGLSSGIYMFAINMPLLIAAFFLISKRFAVTSALGIVLQSGLLILLKAIDFPQYDEETANAVLAAVAGGVLGGAGGGLMLKIGGSCGGTDVIATFIYKRFSATNVSWFIFILDSTVVLVSFFFYGNTLTPVLLALVEMFASARASETILYGLNAALKFEIITSSPKELSEELMKKLHRGVTAIEAKGMYTGTGKTMLVCVVRRSQVSTFQKILKKYPDTFAYISPTSEVIGNGFKSKISPDN